MNTLEKIVADVNLYFKFGEIVAKIADHYYMHIADLPLDGSHDIIATFTSKSNHIVDVTIVVTGCVGRGASFQLHLTEEEWRDHLGVSFNIGDYVTQSDFLVDEIIGRASNDESIFRRLVLPIEKVTFKEGKVLYSTPLNRALDGIYFRKATESEIVKTKLQTLFS